MVYLKFFGMLDLGGYWPECLLHQFGSSPDYSWYSMCLVWATHNHSNSSLQFTIKGYAFLCPYFGASECKVRHPGPYTLDLHNVIGKKLDNLYWVMLITREVKLREFGTTVSSLGLRSADTPIACQCNFSISFSSLWWFRQTLTKRP